MAYLNVAEMYSGPSTDTAPAKAGFTALEWTVIALAEKDSLRSLREPGRLSRALGGVFGRGANSKLAEPRLETLRRLAVHAWKRGYALPASEVATFLRAGFTMKQAETRVASVTGGEVGQLAWKIAG